MKLYELKDVTKLTYPVGININQIIFYIKEVMKCIIDNEVFKNVHYINIWCTGSSGAILSALLAEKITFHYSSITVRIYHIKKEGEHSHNGNFEKLFIDNDMYNIVIDDFVSTGDTLQRIQKHLSFHSVNKVDLLILSSTFIDTECRYDCETGMEVLEHVTLRHFIPDILISGNFYISSSDFTELLKLFSELETTKLC